MTQPIQVQYENKVFKPLTRVRGIREHQTAWMVLCAPKSTRALRTTAGTLNAREAHAMQAVIEKEFEHIEGEW